MKKTALVLAALVLLTGLIGCASTSLVSSDKIAGIPVRHYQKLLIVGLSESAADRQVFEEIFADVFRKQNIKAVSSYTIDDLQAKASREAFTRSLEKSGSDGLLITRFVTVKNRRDKKSGFVIADRGTDFVDYYDYYGDYWEGLESYATFDSRPVEEVLSSVTTLETSLYDAATGKVVWKGISNEANADSLISSTKELAGLVLDALKKEGFVEAR